MTEHSPADIKAFAFKDGEKQHFQVLKELGDCYAAEKDYDRAMQCYAEASGLAPQEAGPHVGMGTIALQQGDEAAATEAFKEALRLDQQCADAFCGLAMVYQKQQSYPAALEMYLRCLERDGDNLVALLGLFQTSCQMGSFSKVIYYLELYLQKHPGDTSVMFCLATLYARDGRLKSAQSLLLNVLALEPDKAEAASLLGSIDEALGENAA